MIMKMCVVVCSLFPFLGMINNITESIQYGDDDASIDGTKKKKNIISWLFPNLLTSKWDLLFTF